MAKKLNAVVIVRGQTSDDILAVYGPYSPDLAECVSRTIESEYGVRCAKHLAQQALPPQATLALVIDPESVIEPGDLMEYTPRDRISDFTNG